MKETQGPTEVGNALTNGPTDASSGAEEKKIEERMKRGWSGVDIDWRIRVESGFCFFP